MDEMTAVAILLTLVAAPAPCPADALDAESRITAVTVFADRAAVTRSAVVDLDSKNTAVRLGPLPGYIEPDSISVKGSGEAAVTLYGVRLQTEQLEVAQDPKIKTLEEEIRGVQRQERRLSNLKRVLERERSYLDSIQAASSEQIGKDLITRSPSAQDASALLGFIDESYLKVAARDQEADLQLEDLARQRDKLERELAQLRQGSTRQETRILVDLGVSKPGRFTLQASYRVPGASWQPIYEARAASDAGKVEFLSYGLVRQQTGESWNDVQVTLSTAKPAMSGTLPELQPLMLRPWEGLQDRRGRVMELQKSISVQSFYDEDKLGNEGAPGAPEPLQSLEATVARAEVQAQGPSVTYRLPREETIPADWQPHKLPIGSQTFAADFTYGSTPRISTYAFLRAKVKNASEQLFLAGPVAVFLDGAFIATSLVKQIAPEEEFDIYLGVDERVKVERKQLKELVEVSLLPGLRGKTKTIDYAFLTTIENFTGQAIRIAVFDLTPVSDRGEIIVESVKLSPEKVEQDKERPGVFRWDLGLTANQKQELRLSYRVRHPVDMTVEGL
jgi:uncharacterized protein (TIGR02231 family)